MKPYFILGTPRSRTAWLADFLSLPERPCLHEPSQWLRGRPALAELLQKPGLAVSDSMLTLRWQDILEACPETRIVVVERPRQGVLMSFARMGIVDPVLERILDLIRAEITKLVSLETVSYVPYHQLDDQATCERIYRFCVGAQAPHGHWRSRAMRKVLASVPTMLQRTAANREGIMDLFPELKEAA